jgi:hypothetical protein
MYVIDDIWLYWWQFKQFHVLDEIGTNEGNFSIWMKLTTKMIIYVIHIANYIYVIIFTLVIFHPCHISFIWQFSSKCKLIHVDKLHSNLHPCSGFHSHVNNYVLQIQMCSILIHVCVALMSSHGKFHHWRSIPYMDNNVIQDGRNVQYVCICEFKPF